MSNRVSLAELAAVGIQLRPAEAVAIVVAICRQRIAGLLSGIPSRGVIRLTRDGDVTVEGPVTIGEDDVARAADLLDELLPGFDAGPDYRASGGLRLVIARALGTLDLPSYASLDDFCVALSRFATLDSAETGRGLFRVWERARAALALQTGDAALTISDVRRARRATGLTLDDIALVAEVPAAQLRDLEWGYTRNWPADERGRAQVSQYARAAGLDEAIVLSIAWPLIVDGSSGQHPAAGTALVRSTAAVPIAAHLAAAPAARGVRYQWVMAVAGVVLAVLATFALAWTERAESQAVPVSQSAAQIAPHAAPDAAEAPAAAVVPAVDVPSAAAPVATAPVVVASHGKAEARRPRLTSRRPAAAPAHRQQKRQPASFFERELFRIVIR